MQINVTKQFFRAGSLFFESCGVSVAGTAPHYVNEWSGEFCPQDFGYLCDSAMDVVCSGKSVVADVTGIKLLHDSAFCFASGDVPKGLPATTLIAKTEQMLFWEQFARDAAAHGLTINVIAKRDCGWGGGLQSLFGSQRFNDYL